MMGKLLIKPGIRLDHQSHGALVLCIDGIPGSFVPEFNATNSVVI